MNTHELNNLKEDFLTVFLDMSCSIRGNRMLERLALLTALMEEATQAAQDVIG